MDAPFRWNGNVRVAPVKALILPAREVVADMALLVITWLVSIFACHFIAKRRGANAVYWGIMAALVGPLAIPFVFFSKRQS